MLRLLHEAEVIVAQMQSVCTKFGLLAQWQDEEGEAPIRRKDAEETREVSAFVLRLLDAVEVEVPSAGKGAVGRRIRQLFADAQKVSGSGCYEVPPYTCQSFSLMNNLTLYIFQIISNTHMSYYNCKW